VAERTDLTRPGIVARRQVLLELSASRRMEELYARDLPKGLAEWEDLSALINEFSYVVLCGCWVENPDEVIDARRARRGGAVSALPAMARAIGSGWMSPCRATVTSSQFVRQP